MSQSTERRRHEALAKQTASWRSWVCGTWWTNGYMAVELLEPFHGVAMRLDYECLCSNFDKNQHRATVERVCTYVDEYEPDDQMTKRLSKTLALLSERTRMSVLRIETDTIVESLNEPGMEMYRARIGKSTEDNAWVAINRRYYEVVQEEARPDSWILAWPNGINVGDRITTVQIPSILALRGTRCVASVMPIACPGSALGIAPEEAAS